MIKDVHHSELTKTLEYHKNEVKRILDNIISTKQMIGLAIQVRNYNSIEYYNNKLRNLRYEINKLSNEIRTIRKDRSTYQHNKSMEERNNNTHEKPLKDVKIDNSSLPESMNWRMYSIVLRQLNPMQKGVQALHSVVEYSNKYGYLVEYVKWATVNKTMIILDGGTSPEMDEIIKKLSDLKVINTTFREPDLNYLVTSISFLASERVWDREKYPDYGYYSLVNQTEDFPATQSVPYIDSIRIPTKEEWAEKVFNMSVEDVDNIIEFRKFIFSKRLAQ